MLRIQALVTDYLEHEKAATLRTQPVDLYRACRDLQILLSELLRSTGTKFTIIAPQSPILAACDPHALRQVLLNIVLNAQQAMGRLGQITIAIGEEDTKATLSISDTGPGIPESVKENLFKPFQSTKTEGTGIGLALVKRFADNFRRHRHRRHILLRQLSPSNSSFQKRRQPCRNDFFSAVTIR